MTRNLAKSITALSHVPVAVRDASALTLLWSRGAVFPSYLLVALAPPPLRPCYIAAT